MSLPTLHILGVPHTLSFNSRYTHCAFTTKVNRFVPMMKSVGYEVIHYGNGLPARSVCYSKDTYKFNFQNVEILSEEELEKFTGIYDPSSSAFVGANTDCVSPVYKEFNQRLALHLDARVQPNDIICLPFGHGHSEALARTKAKVFTVETGIGYDQVMPETFKIFESSAWMHYHYGKAQATLGCNRGSDYDFVIPNYFDLDEWKINTGPGEYVLYFGRICEAKGLNIVWELAKRRPDLKFVICGQGNAAPWLTLPNIEHRAPVHGDARSELLGRAIAVLCPSRYVEPFGGTGVEAMLCGRPMLASVFGAFSETVGPLSFQCRRLFDWLAALEYCEQYTRNEYLRIANYARTKYSMFAIAKLYDRAFKQIHDLTRGGWYATDKA